MAAALAIVVVSHSSGATLADCVERALADPGVAELLVVDNRSVDGSIEALEARFGGDARFALVRNATNLGFAQACNQGAAATSAPYLMFLNPDCLLERDSVPRLLELARSHPDAGVIGADVRDAGGNPEPAARRRDPTVWRSVCSALGLDRYAARWPALAGITMPVPHAARDVSRVDATSGALLLMPRAAFDRLAGFDPGYPLHAEDLDLCRRARRAGYAVLVAERVRVTHYKGGSSGSAPWRVAWCKHLGLWRYYRKFEAASWPARAAAWLMVFGHFALLAPWLALRQWRAAVAARS